jgi:hypothetical protein
MSQSSTRYVGLDVHKDSIAVAYVAKDHEAHVIYYGTIGTRHADMDQRTRKLQSVSEVVCATPAQQIVFQEYVRAVNEHTERLQCLEQELHEQVQAWRLQPEVAVNIERQEIAGLVRRASGRGSLDAVKAKSCQIEFINEGIDEADRVIC